MHIYETNIKSEQIYKCFKNLYFLVYEYKQKVFFFYSQFIFCIEITELFFVCVVFYCLYESDCDCKISYCSSSSRRSCLKLQCTYTLWIQSHQERIVSEICWLKASLFVFQLRDCKSTSNSSIFDRLHRSNKQSGKSGKQTKLQGQNAL